MIKGSATETGELVTLLREHILKGVCAQVQLNLSLIYVKLDDRRSQYCKEVCNTITLVAQTLQRDFEEFASIILPCLFKLLIVTIKPISEPAHQCILSFLKYLAECEIQTS